MLNFDFLGKGLGIVSHHILFMILQEKSLCFILLNSDSHLPNKILSFASLKAL